MPLDTNKLVTQSDAESEHSQSLDYLVSKSGVNGFDWSSIPYTRETSEHEVSGIGSIVESRRNNMTEQPMENDSTLEEHKLFPKGTATLESIFYFGKHRGKQVEDVIEDNPSYIQWLSDMEVIEFDEETYEVLSKIGLV